MCSPYDEAHLRRLHRGFLNRLICADSSFPAGCTLDYVKPITQKHNSSLVLESVMDTEPWDVNDPFELLVLLWYLTLSFC